ncbi:MAG: Gldg family protein [Gemmataceae bacterium]
MNPTENPTGTPADTSSPAPRKFPFDPLVAAALGSFLGLCLVITGFILPFSPLGIDPESKTVRLAGSLENWRKHAWFVMLVAGMLFGGLALMFASLQLLRDQERKNQAMRRLVYGFNAFLGTVLLLSVLGLINLLAYTDPIDRVTSRLLSREFDWTKTGIYTLSPRTVAFLESLQEPVKVYLFTGVTDQTILEMMMLLRNCEQVNREFKWETLGFSRESVQRIRELMKKYAIQDPTGGALVIVGNENGQHAHEFLTPEKLGRENFDRFGGRRKFTFTGENALLGTLTSLTQGQVIIYFTQGHGEPTLDAPPMIGGGSRTPPSLNSLKQRLTANRTRFEVKPLKLDASLAKIPDDATTVVIVGPTQPFGDHEVQLLRDYLKRQPQIAADKSVRVHSGRLMALLGPVIGRGASGAKFESTGLDSLLEEYGVKLGEERVQSAVGDDPLRVDVLINPESDNPLNRAFNDLPNVTWFPLLNVRTVQAAEKQPGTLVKVNPELLLIAARAGIWAEKDLSRDPTATARAIQTDTSMRKLLSREPLPVGIAVSQRSPAAAKEPGMPPEEGKERPVMLVVGSSAWVLDENLRGPSGDLRFDLFSSALSWLREQSDLGKLVEDKATPEYELKATPEDGRIWRLYILPGILMMLGVVSLGIGVWVVRRR